MSKQHLTVFLCTGKDCCKAWSHITEDSPGKWLKRLVKEADLPYKLDIIKTECMDQCEQSACLCIVADHSATWEMQIGHRDDADRVLAGLRACAESVDVGSEVLQ